MHKLFKNYSYRRAKIKFFALKHDCFILLFQLPVSRTTLWEVSQSHVDYSMEVGSVSDPEPESVDLF